MQFFWAILEVAIAGVVGIGLVTILRTREEAHFAGLRAAIVGYVIYSVAPMALGAAFHLPLWVGLVLLIPLIEESCRLFFGFRAKDQLVGPYGWLSFGVGYACFEGMLKLFGAGMAVLSGDRSWLALIAPLVSISLLVCLGVYAAFAIQKGRRWWAILPITFGAHAVHNWTTIEQIPSTVDGYLSWTALRMALFVALTAYWLHFGARQLPVTNASERATSTP